MFRTVLAFLLALLLSGVAGAQSSGGRYWKIGTDNAHVWSLTDNALVANSNAGYLAWLAAGNRVATIGSTAELYDVLSQSFSTNLLASAPGLEAIAPLNPLQSFLWRRGVGVAITYTGNAGLSGQYPIDDQWLGGLMSGALLRCGTTPLEACLFPMPLGSSTYTYFAMGMQPKIMSVVQMRTIVLGIQDYVANLQLLLAAGLTGGSPTWPAPAITVP
jgi:hypothetical protein